MSTVIVHICDTFMVTLAGEDDIHTTVTSSASVVTSWLSNILSVHRHRLHMIVGLDAEWLPNFVSGQNNPVALLQLCVGHRCLLYQIRHADYIPRALFDFLSDDRFTVVGVKVADDVKKLHDGYGVEVRCDVVDLRDLAAEETGREEMRKFGLEKLAREVMGIHLEKDKEVQLSSWDRVQLKREQVAYAAVDGFVSFEVGRRLMAGEEQGWIADLWSARQRWPLRCCSGACGKFFRILLVSIIILAWYAKTQEPNLSHRPS